MIALESLTSAQQLVVWSARSWVRGYNSGEPVMEQLELAYELTGIRSTAKDVDTLFGIISNGTRHYLNFGAPHCPAVHAVEATLINCLGAFQCGNFPQAARILGDMLHTQSAVHASVPAHRWAMAMKDVGWPLEFLPMNRVLAKERQEADDQAADDRSERHDTARWPVEDHDLQKPDLRNKGGGIRTPPPGVTIH